MANFFCMRRVLLITIYSVHICFECLFLLLFCHRCVVMGKFSWYVIFCDHCDVCMLLFIVVTLSIDPAYFWDAAVYALLCLHVAIYFWDLLKKALGILR